MICNVCVLVCVLVSSLRLKVMLTLSVVLQGLGYEQVPQHPVSDKPNKIPAVCQEVDQHQKVVWELLQGKSGELKC